MMISKKQNESFMKKVFIDDALFFFDLLALALVLHIDQLKLFL